MDSEHERLVWLELLDKARPVCRQVLDGSVTPYDAARVIAAWCRSAGVHPPPELHTFVYAESEWDERPEDGNIFAEGVVAAARELAGWKPRRH